MLEAEFKGPTLLQKEEHDFSHIENMRSILNPFEEDLTILLNRFSIENESNTPDFIYSKFIVESICELKLYNQSSLDVLIKDTPFTEELVKLIELHRVDLYLSISSKCVCKYILDMIRIVSDCILARNKWYALGAN